MKRVEDELNDILSRDCKKFIDEIRGTKSLLYRGTMKFVNDYAIFNSRIDDRRPRDLNVDLHNDLNNEFVKKFGWKVRNGVFAVSLKSIAGGYGLPYIFLPVGNYKYVWSPSVYDILFFNIKHNIVRREYLENKYKEATYLLVYSIENNGPFSLDDMLKMIEGKVSTKPGKYIGIIKTPILNFNIGDKVSYNVKRSIDFDKWRMKYYDKTMTVDEVVDTFIDKSLKEAISSNNEISFNCNKYYLVDSKYKEFILGVINK